MPQPTRSTADGSGNALFARYPRLREALPHVALGQWPTPVGRLDKLERALGEALGGGRLYVKRDDLSGAPYGGNKVRKLEFLLGRAMQDQRKAVLTFGGAGSNHALATAVYAQQLGLQSISMLVPQPNARSVRRNLLLSHRVGAEMHHNPGMVSTVAASMWQCLRRRLRNGAFPQIIPPGGTSPVGMVGFVAAALELGQQVANGALPEPDCLYAASGTMGTVIGLLLGFKAAALRTRVVAVRVTPPMYTSMRKAHRYFRATNALLHHADPSFPLFEFPEDQFELRHDFFGQQYALYTEEATRAVRQMKDTEGIALEATYTGKTLAALLADLAAGALRDNTVLFWNTYNSHDFTADVEGLDYTTLPKSVHRYFEQDVQPLDR